MKINEIRGSITHLESELKKLFKDIPEIRIDLKHKTVRGKSKPYITLEQPNPYINPHINYMAKKLQKFNGLLLYFGVDYKETEQGSKQTLIIENINKKIGENSMKLKKVINEIQKEKEQKQIKTPNMSLKEFSQFIENFNSIGKNLQETQKLVEVSKKLVDVCSMAETYSLKEEDNWFDQLTVKRNMKELNSYSKEFQKLAEDANTVNQRMIGLYEDMGNILGRYFEIKEVEDNITASQNLAVDTPNQDDLEKKSIT